SDLPTLRLLLYRGGCRLGRRPASPGTGAVAASAARCGGAGRALAARLGRTPLLVGLPGLAVRAAAAADPVAAIVVDGDVAGGDVVVGSLIAAVLAVVVVVVAAIAPVAAVI